MQKLRNYELFLRSAGKTTKLPTFLIVGLIHSPIVAIPFSDAPAHTDYITKNILRPTPAQNYKTTNFFISAEFATCAFPSFRRRFQAFEGVPLSSENICFVVFCPKLQNYELFYLDAQNAKKTTKLRTFLFLGFTRFFWEKVVRCLNK